MDLRQLRYFEAVVRHCHFTRAAEELHVAQSAISHHVRGLEQELGIALLQRTTRSVAATEAGGLVAARARAVIAETDALRAEIDELRGLVRGHIAIGAMLFGGKLDIPGILGSFSAKFPGVEIELREGTAQRMLQMLRDGSLDLTFALEVEPPAEIERVELSSEELALAMRPAHPLADRGPVSLADLRDEPLIAFQHGSSTRTMVDGALARAGVNPRIALEANDFALVRSLVARGLGLAVLPRSFLERPGEPISVSPLTPPLRMAVVLWWLRGRRRSPAARAFVDFAAAAQAASGSSEADSDGS
jgi:DNA-binding transcriptional LysR family regulator